MNETPVVLQVAVNGYADKFAEYLWRTHQWAWARGYLYRMVTAPCNLPRDDCGWLKLACAERLLQQHRTVFMVDADAYVTKNCPVLSAITRDDKEIYAKLGPSGRINSGVMIFHHGFPESTLTTAFQKLFGCANDPVPKEDRAPQENGHVIHCWKYWPTLQILPKGWNFNSYGERQTEMIPFVVHGESPDDREEYLNDYKRQMRRNSKKKNPQPVWYKMLHSKARKESRATRVRFYARKLQEIGIL